MNTSLALNQESLVNLNPGVSPALGPSVVLNFKRSGPA